MNRSVVGTGTPTAGGTMKMTRTHDDETNETVFSIPKFPFTATVREGGAGCRSSVFLADKGGVVEEDFAVDDVAEARAVKMLFDFYKGV